jgi:hypothetical protein
MAWTMKGNPKTEKVTKALAERFAKMTPCPSDRPLSEQRLLVYERIALAGGFRPVSWGVCYCKQTGGTYRVNGKHTSLLFSRLDLANVPPLYVVTEYYEADTLDDVGRLYATYDSRTQTRNAGDINRSFAACVPALEGVDGRTTNPRAGAIWYAQKLERYRDMTTAERAEGLLEHSDFVVWVHRLFPGGKGGGVARKYRHPERMAVYAAIFSTRNSHSRLALQFWEEVRDETGGKPNLPTRKPGKFLLMSAAANMPAVRRYKIRDKEFYVKCIHAWNAWRAGETTELKYYADKPVPATK